MGIRSLAAELLPSALQGLGRIAHPTPAQTTGEASSFAVLTDKLAYLSKGDLRQVRDAFKFADEAHLGQFRASGEPYITHPLAVAGQHPLEAVIRQPRHRLLQPLSGDYRQDKGSGCPLRRRGRQRAAAGNQEQPGRLPRFPRSLRLCPR